MWRILIAAALLLQLAAAVSYRERFDLNPVNGVGRAWDYGTVFPYERYRAFQSSAQVLSPTDGVLFSFGVQLDPTETTYSGSNNPVAHVAFTSLNVTATPYDQATTIVSFVELLISHDSIAVFYQSNSRETATRKSLPNIALPATLTNINSDRPVYYWIYLKGRTFYVGAGTYPTAKVVTFINNNGVGVKPSVKDGLLTSPVVVPPGLVPLGTLNPPTWTPRDIVLGSYSSKTVTFKDLHVFELLASVRIDTFTFMAKFEVRAYCDNVVTMWVNNNLLNNQWSTVNIVYNNYGAGSYSLVELPYNTQHLFAAQCWDQGGPTGGLIAAARIDDQTLFATDGSSIALRSERNSLHSTSQTWWNALAYNDDAWQNLTICPNRIGDYDSWRGVVNWGYPKAFSSWANPTCATDAAVPRIDYRAKFTPTFRGNREYVSSSAFDTSIPNPSNFIIHYSLLLSNSASFAPISTVNSGQMQVGFTPTEVFLRKSTGKVARFVRISMNIRADVIWLNEIQVFDEDGKTITTGVRASQSSIVNNRPDVFGPQNLIDGVIGIGPDTIPASGSMNWINMCHTNGNVGEWVEIDLGTERVVSKVVVWNREDGGRERITGANLQLLTAQRVETYRYTFPDNRRTFTVDTLGWIAPVTIVSKPHNLNLNLTTKTELWTLVKGASIIVGAGAKPSISTVAYLLSSSSWTSSFLDGLSAYSDVLVWYFDETENPLTSYSSMRFKFDDATTQQFSDVYWLNPLDQLYDVPFTFTCPAATILEDMDADVSSLWAFGVQNSTDTAKLVPGFATSNIDLKYINSYGSTASAVSAADVLELKGAAPLRLTTAKIRNRRDNDNTAVDCKTINPLYPSPLRGCNATEPWKIVMQLSTAYTGSRTVGCDVRVSPAEDAPVSAVSSNSLTVLASTVFDTKSKILTPSLFPVTDVDTEAGEIEFEIVANSTLVHGDLKLKLDDSTPATTLIIGSKFTQENLAALQVSYESKAPSDLSDKMDTIYYQVCSKCGRVSAIAAQHDLCNDAAYTASRKCSGPYTLGITVSSALLIGTIKPELVKDLSSFKIVVNENTADAATRVVLDTKYLQITDVDNTAGELGNTKFVFTSPPLASQGALVTLDGQNKESSPLAASDQVAYNPYVTGNRLVFIPKENYNGEVSITFKLRDIQNNEAGPFTFAITVAPVNTPPYVPTNLSPPPLYVNERSSTQLTQIELPVADMDDGSSAAWFVTVKETVPSAGLVVQKLVGSDWTEVVGSTYFTIDDVYNKRVRVASAAKSTPAAHVTFVLFNMEKGVPVGTSTEFKLVVQVASLKPFFNSPADGKLDLLERELHTLNSSTLSAVSFDKPASEILVSFSKDVVTNFGEIRVKVGDSFKAADEFTQADIDAGHVQLAVKTNPISGGFVVKFTAKFADGTQTAQTSLIITITAIDDPPTLTAGKNMVTDSATRVLIKTENILVEDLDSPANETLLTFTIKVDKGGVLRRVSSADSDTVIEAGSSFTREELAKNIIFFEPEKDFSGVVTVTITACSISQECSPPQDLVITVTSNATGGGGASSQVAIIAGSVTGVVVLLGIGVSAVIIRRGQSKKLDAVKDTMHVMQQGIANAFANMMSMQADTMRTLQQAATQGPLLIGYGPTDGGAPPVRGLLTNGFMEAQREAMRAEAGDNGVERGFTQIANIQAAPQTQRVMGAQSFDMISQAMYSDGGASSFAPQTMRVPGQPQSTGFTQFAPQTQRVPQATGFTQFAPQTQRVPPQQPEVFYGEPQQQAQQQSTGFTQFAPQTQRVDLSDATQRVQTHQRSASDLY